MTASGQPSRCTYRIDRLADIGPENVWSEFLVDGRNQFRSCHGSLVLPLLPSVDPVPVSMQDCDAEL